VKFWLLLLPLLLALPVAAAEDHAAQCREDAQRGLTKACQKAIAANPQDPELHALLGHAYFASGFYAEGLQALRDAIAASGGSAAYRYRFAGFAALINDYPQAARELELAVADEPDSLKAWTLLADCYRYMKDQKQALRAGRKAAELGDAAEAYLLASRYNSGDGVGIDPAEELRWLERAARAGYVAAMQDLALLYAEGRPGIPADPAKRKYWDDKARRQD
jgi:TPR repeat protein